MRRILILLTFCLLTSTSALALAAYNTFSDVDDNAWYAESVEELADLNILQGHPDGTYRPTDFVNRAELAVILDRFLEYIETGTVELDSNNVSIELDVPFSSQAPTGDWGMPYQEACEEAALMMVNAFWKEEGTSDAELVSLLDWVEDDGYGVDVSAEQMAEIARDYYDLDASVYYDDMVDEEGIKSMLDAGYPVIVPVAGQVLAHPNYTAGGPLYHVIVIVGYNVNGFIVHDPGVTLGGSYVYSYATIDEALHDWTGSKSTVEAEGRPAMVVLSMN